MVWRTAKEGGEFISCIPGSADPAAFSPAAIHEGKYLVAKFTQADRPIGVLTPLGTDKLVLTSFRGDERLSGLFNFTLLMLSDEGGIKPLDLVGKRVDFYVRFPDGKERFFNGLVKRFAYAGQDDRAHMYEAEVVPWLWLLTRGSDCRVHVTDKAKNAKDIIDGLLKDLGFADYEWKLKRTPEKRQYCVQYRETHFDFISRLLEEEGIYYYFQHEQGKHKLILTDHINGVYDVKDSEVRLHSNLSEAEISDNLYSWTHEHAFTSGKWAKTDYNFETPKTSLMADTTSLVKLTGNSQLEFYDFPGNYEQKGQGTSLVKIRMEEEEAGHNFVAGSSHCRSFSPGGRFKISEHHVKSEIGTKWVLTSVQHTATVGGNYVAGGQHSDRIYENSFHCIPAETVFRPAREHQKPSVQGVHSAVVVGPAGDEIFTDKYGRVKVQFPWDRKGKNDDKSSLWVRVATPWAGQKWGMVHIPRIGQEVVVNFFEGDPDKPVIIGMMYNADNMPPYSLPDHKTQSGIKTHSSQKASDANFNEIRFEDKKDSEEIYVHAEKDLKCVVENNESRKVGYDKKDKGDQEIDIYNDQKLKVGIGSSAGSHTIDIHKDRTTTLVQGNDSLTLKQGNMSVAVKVGNSTTVLDKGNESTTLKMGNATTQLDMGNQTTTLKMGNQTTKLNLGKIVMEAMQSIEFKVGPNSIKIDPSGVTIKGVMVNVEGTAMATVKAPMTQIKGDGMVMAKGGIVMIN